MSVVRLYWLISLLLNISFINAQFVYLTFFSTFSKLNFVVKPSRRCCLLGVSVTNIASKKTIKCDKKFTHQFKHRNHLSINYGQGRERRFITFLVLTQWFHLFF